MLFKSATLIVPENIDRDVEQVESNAVQRRAGTVTHGEEYHGDRKNKLFTPLQKRTASLLWCLPQCSTANVLAKDVFFEPCFV